MEHPNNLPNLTLNLLGIIYGTQLRSTRLSPLEKTVLSFLQGVDLHQKVHDSKSYTSFSDKAFNSFASKYKNNIFKKIPIEYFKNIAKGLEKKSEIKIEFDPYDEIILIIKGGHTKGWSLPVFEIEPSLLQPQAQDESLSEEKAEDSESEASKSKSGEELLVRLELDAITDVVSGNKYEYNYIAFLTLSILLKCAAQSLEEGNAYYVYTNQIQKLNSLTRFPEGIIDDAINYLIDKKAIYTEESLADPEYRFTMYRASKVKAIYINESLVKSYFKLFETIDIFEYSTKLNEPVRALTSKYR